MTATRSELTSSARPDNNPTLSPAQQISVRRQEIISWLQTLLLIVVVLQSLFAGVMEVLPPDVRASLAFLHRIEWGVYAGVILIVAQVAVGWTDSLVLTNRFNLLAWRFGALHPVVGRRARVLQGVYLLVALAMIGVAVWVRIHGFIFQPTTR